MAALDGTFALAQVDDVAVLVGQHLDLDVANRVEQLLQVNAVVAEGGARLAAGDDESPAAGLAGCVDAAHALAAAAGDGLHQQRVTDVGALGHQVIVVQHLLHARDDRDAGGAHRPGGRPSCRPSGAWPTAAGRSR